MQVQSPSAESSILTTESLHTQRCDIHHLHRRLVSREIRNMGPLD